MKPKFFTLGYSGRKPAEIQAIADQLNAIVVDIRFSPKSRVPYWNKGPLTNLLGTERYTHLQLLGNQNYKGGPIQIVNYEQGKKALELAHKNTGKNFILMCACADFTTCHRTTIANQLRADGYEVEEYTDRPDLEFDEDKPKRKSPTAAKVIPMQLLLF